MHICSAQFEEHRLRHQADQLIDGRTTWRRLRAGQPGEAATVARY
jgi:hypothetical protein